MNMEFEFKPLFENHDTGVGELGEEIVADLFSDIYSKKSNGKKVKDNINNIYNPFFKQHNIKANEFDLLQGRDPLESFLNGNKNEPLALLTKDEIKIIRATRSRKRQKGSRIDYVQDSLANRALPFEKIKELSNPTWQQCKPLQFDWLIGIIICSDKFLGYLIKSSPELLKRMKPQHKGAIKEDGTFDEGHVLWNDKDRMKIFEFNSIQEIKDSYGKLRLQDHIDNYIPDLQKLTFVTKK